MKTTDMLDVDMFDENIKTDLIKIDGRLIRVMANAHIVYFEKSKNKDYVNKITRYQNGLQIEEPIKCDNISQDEFIKQFNEKNEMACLNRYNNMLKKAEEKGWFWDTAFCVWRKK